MTIQKRVKIDIEKFKRRREKTEYKCGKAITVSDIAVEFGKSHRTIYSWIEHGWPYDRFGELAELMGSTVGNLKRSISVSK